METYQPIVKAEVSPETLIYWGRYSRRAETWEINTIVDEIIYLTRSDALYGDKNNVLPRVRIQILKNELCNRTSQ